jgi:mRNA interferase MazF
MVRRGTVLLLSLDPAIGHEQKGLRPAIAVSDPAIIDSHRFPLLAVVPLTGTPGRGALYPAVRAGKSGLKMRSFALIDQVRSVDKGRVVKVFGRVSPGEMGEIDEGLRLFFGLG